MHNKKVDAAASAFFGVVEMWIAAGTVEGDVDHATPLGLPMGGR